MLNFQPPGSQAGVFHAPANADSTDTTDVGGGRCGNHAADDALMRVLVASHTYTVSTNQGKFDAVVQTGKAEVGLLVPRVWKSPELGREYRLEAPYSSLRVFPQSVWLGERSGTFIYNPLSLLGILRAFRPRLLHVEQEAFSASALQLALAARLSGIPMVLFCWENVDRRFSIVRRLTRRIVLTVSTALIAGNHGAAALHRRWGFRGPIDVMPQLGVDLGLFKPVTESKRAADFVVGFVGRLARQKGVDVLFRAANRLLSQGQPIQIRLYGAGPEERSLRQLAASLELDQFIDWRGSIAHDEVPAALRELHALVLPSRSDRAWTEQFGHVLIEAMASGVPVLGSTCGEIPFVIGRSDLLFEEEDDEELALLLGRLAVDDYWHSEIRNYGLQRVRSQYSHGQVARRLINLWQRVLAEE